ncbi:helix-turn-helix domain-containing protein, partial [Glutamicibacter protophormiae]|uniref:helix-turn-helix domain-containing protein n=1 Tax=Glutamicibacter protophormiae TaxID=37930 RepID=UPI003BAFB260
ALGTATAKLLLHGQPESARLVAEEAGMDELPSRVRVLALSLDDETEVRTVIQALGALPAGAALPPVAEAAARCQLRFTDDGVLYLLLDEAQLGKTSAAAPGQDPEPSAGDTARNLRAVLSAPLTLAELPANLPALRQNLSGAPAGELSDAGADFDASAQTWVEALAAYTRADLLSAVTQYLRHRGHWEDASRALGIHRNSLRHRITVAGDLLGIDLDDPDISASLWLALRRNQG